MIDRVFQVLSKDLQDYLSRLPELNITSEAVVNTTPVVKFDGSMAIPEGSLGLTLVNIEEERIVKSQIAVARAPDGQVSNVNPEIKLNLFGSSRIIVKKSKAIHFLLDKADLT